MVEDNTGTLILSKGMQQTTVGVIPEDWEVVRISECSTKITDGEHLTPQRTKSGYFLLSARNILNGKIDVKDVDYVGYEEYQRIRLRCNPEFGDVLISCSGSIGRVATVPKNFECVMVRSAALVKPDYLVTSGFYIQFFLQSAVGQNQIFTSMNQGAQPNLFLNHIQEIQIPLPPLPEQQAIAEALSDADAWIESLEDLIAKKRLIKQGTMQELLTPKEGWEVKKLGEVLNKTPDYGINAAAVSFDDKLPTYLRITDIGDNGEFLSQTKVSVDSLLSPNYILDIGDICVARTGASVGKSYYHQQKNGILVFAGFLIRLKVNSEILSSRLLFYITKSHAYYDFINSNSMRSGQPGINSMELQSFEISYPKLLSEQTRIATIVSDMDTELEQLEQKLTKARQLKQGMMQELLTGRVRLV